MKTHCEICGCRLQDPEHHNQYPCEDCGKVTCDDCAWDVEEGDIQRIVCVRCEAKRMGVQDLIFVQDLCQLESDCPSPVTGHREV